MYKGIYQKPEEYAKALLEEHGKEKAMEIALEASKNCAPWDKQYWKKVISKIKYHKE